MREAMMRIATVGLLGLGNMGAAIADRLLDAGTELIVYDLDPLAMARLTQRGAKAATSCRDVADRASIVMACLPSVAVSLSVARSEERRVGKEVVSKCRFRR